MPVSKRKLEKQFEKTKETIDPTKLPLDTLREFYKLLVMFYEYLESKKDE